MKYLASTAVALALAIALASPAEAAKPRDDNGDFLGNGYPSGEHFNLNILGKKDNFVCPDPEFNWTFEGGGEPFVGTAAECEAHRVENNLGACVQGEQAYGGVVFMRRNEDGLVQDPVQIEFQSGRKGPKGAPAITELRATDWCSTDVDGNPAVVQLPANSDGYAVYGRVTGKPTHDPSFSFTDRGLTLVEDDFGNDLYLLGLVSSEGAFVCPGGENCTLLRSDSGGKGKKVRDAVDLSSLFSFDGAVCYINDESVDMFCGDETAWEDNNCAVRTDVDGLEQPVCCLPAELEPNGDITVLATCQAAEDSADGGYTACQDNAGLVEDPAGTSTGLGGGCLGDPVSNECPNDGNGTCEAGELCLYSCPTSLLVEDPAFTASNLGGSCADADPTEACPNDGDGICELAADSGTGFDEGCTDLVADNGSEACGIVPVCKDFAEDPQWIFNIEAFVNVLFGAENNGSYNVKLRFYPLPLDIDAQ